MTETDVVNRIKAIDWFARCGEPAAFDLTMSVETVRDWPQAMAACQTPSWEDIELEAQNQLTVALHRIARDRYQQWNDIVRTFKDDLLTPLRETVWQPFQERRGLPITLVHCVQWDILGALMENAYMGSNHEAFFFLELLTVYEAGHFPCGWRGEWPEGQLLVF